MKFVLTFALLISPLIAERNGFPTTFMQYPLIALHAGIQGDVTLDVTIGKDGDIQKVVVFKSSHPILAKDAEENMRTWRFGPAPKGDPETITIRFTYEFRIDQSIRGKRMEFMREENIIIVSTHRPPATANSQAATEP
jgi:TonB family protein